MTEFRMADDSCLFCGRHGTIAGGHYFIGKYIEEPGWYESKDKWLAIEHLNQCYIQICPNCREKYNLKA